MSKSLNVKREMLFVGLISEFFCVDVRERCLKDRSDVKLGKHLRPLYDPVNANALALDCRKDMPVSGKQPQCPGSLVTVAAMGQAAA